MLNQSKIFFCVEVVCILTPLTARHPAVSYTKNVEVVNA